MSFGASEFLVAILAQQSCHLFLYPRLLLLQLRKLRDLVRQLFAVDLVLAVELHRIREDLLVYPCGVIDLRAQTLRPFEATLYFLHFYVVGGQERGNLHMLTPRPLRIRLL